MYYYSGPQLDLTLQLSRLNKRDNLIAAVL